MQCLKESIGSWALVLSEAHRVLKPGGWVENVEYSSTVFSDHPDFPVYCPTISKLVTQLQQASNNNGISLMAVESDCLKTYIARADLVTDYWLCVRCFLMPTNRSKLAATFFLRTAFATDLEGEAPLTCYPFYKIWMCQSYIRTCLSQP